MSTVRAIVVAMVVAGCGGHTVIEDFLDVRPVREVPALAGKQLAAIDGTRCKEICASKRDWDSINYCVIATIAANPHLQCRVRRSGGTAPGYAFDVLVDVPPSVDLATLPAKGAVPIELCEAAGCRSKMSADDVPIIDACSVYPYRPDKTEPFVVCSFHDERPARTM
jgi:hypothetical protein